MITEEETQPKTSTVVIMTGGDAASSESSSLKEEPARIVLEDNDVEEGQENDKDDEDDEDQAADLICPISHERMQDPVSLVQTGSSYDCQSLCQCLLVHPDLDPLTGLRFSKNNEDDENKPPLSYRPNLELRGKLMEMYGPNAYVPYDDSDFEEQYQKKWLEKKTSQVEANQNNNNNRPPYSRKTVITGVIGFALSAILLTVMAVNGNRGHDYDYQTGGLPNTAGVQNCHFNQESVSISSQYYSVSSVGIWPVFHWVTAKDNTTTTMRGLQFDQNRNASWPRDGYFWRPGRDYFLNISCPEACPDLAGSVSIRYCTEEGVRITLLRIDKVQDVSEKFFAFTIPRGPNNNNTTLASSDSGAASSAMQP